MPPPSYSLWCAALKVMNNTNSSSTISQQSVGGRVSSLIWTKSSKRQPKRGVLAKLLISCWQSARKVSKIGKEVTTRPIPIKGGRFSGRKIKMREALFWLNKIQKKDPLSRFKIFKRLSIKGIHTKGTTLQDSNWLLCFSKRHQLLHQLFKLMRNQMRPCRLKLKRNLFGPK